MSNDARNKQVVGFTLGSIGYGLFFSWMWVICFSNFAVSHAGMDHAHATMLRIIMLAALAASLPVFGLCQRFFITRRGIITSAALSVVLCPLASVSAMFSRCLCEQPCTLPCTCDAMLIQAAAWALSGIGYALLMVYWSWYLVALVPKKNHAMLLVASMAVSSGVFFLSTLFMADIALLVHILLPALSVALSVFSHRQLVNSDKNIEIMSTAPMDGKEKLKAKLSKRTVIMTWFSGVALGFCGHTVTSSNQAAASDPALSACLFIAAMVLVLLVKKRGDLDYRDTLWLYVPAVVFCLVPMSAASELGRGALSCILISLLTAYSFVDLNALVSDLPRVATHVVKTMAFGRIGNVSGMAIGWGVGGAVALASDSQPSLFSYTCLGLVMLLVAAATYMFYGPKFSGTLDVVKMPEADCYEGQCRAFAKKYKLTPRQLEVLRLLGRGRTAPFIQDRLFISESTAKSHIYNIYQKAQIHSQRELMDLLEAMVPEEDETR